MKVPMPAMPVIRSTHRPAPFGPGSTASSASCDSLSGLARQICYTNVG